MPREHIRMNESNSQRGWVSVGWMKNAEYVQIATDREMLVGQEPTVPIGAECFAAADESVICWKGRNYIPQEEHGIWADFPSRGAVNDLIRLLRKARDQAFGRDE